ncbi:MAG: methylenetetrahydrofolate reductase [NAD(P)H] [Deferribacterota bacterium]|nr:methylenetetrahydrofolate reductase [NAD(P)H] [Deferribacterota bacterium]
MEVLIKIIDKLNSKDASLSFEYFPPKEIEKEDMLFNTISTLSRYNPDFSSVTYSPKNLNLDKTLKWTIMLKQKFHIESMMHLTAFTISKEDVIEVTKKLKASKIENILALRGDNPDNLTIKKNSFKYALSLIEFIKKIDNTFCIGCAGYPEGHIEAENFDKDLYYLNKKIEAGASFIITQLFFINDYFYRFIDKLNKKGINAPVICGIMPITNLKQIIKFTKICGVTIPKELLEKLEDKSSEEVIKIGAEYTINQCLDLIDNGFKKFHFYTLNKTNAVETILNSLRTTLTI